VSELDVVGVLVRMGCRLGLKVWEVVQELRGGCQEEK